MHNPPKILIRSACPLLCIGLRVILAPSEFQVVGETTDLTQLSQIAHTEQPDVVLLDTELPGSDLIHRCMLLSEVARTCGIVLLVPPSLSEDRLFPLIRHGVRAFLPTTTTGETLVETLRCVVSGKSLLPSRMVAAWSPHVPEKKRELHALTPREILILLFIMQGKENKHIATTLQIAESTVKNHITSILKKIHAPNRTAAVIFALKHKIITFEDALGQEHKSVQSERIYVA